MVYVNDDGLHIRFGNEQGAKALAGAPNTAGTEKELVVDLDFSRMPAFGDASTFINGTPAAPIPAGALLRSATIILTTIFTSGGAPTLTLGMSQNDATVIDADGIDATIALADLDAIGTEVACDGALVGTILAENSYVTIDVATADYTAGRGKLVIKYIIPDA